MTQFLVSCSDERKPNMETRTSLSSLRVLGFSMAGAAVALTALVSLLSRGNPAVVAPVAMTLPFIAVAVLDAFAANRRGRNA